MFIRNLFGLGYTGSQQTIILFQMDVKEERFKRRIKSMVYRVDHGRGIIPDKSPESGDDHAIVPV
jgi:hypothetical protein